MEGYRAQAERAASEAISALGLLLPAAHGDLVDLLKRTFTTDARATTIHPRQASSQFRKDGRQLSAEAKRAAGIRTNGYMSEHAYAQLSEAGRRRPLLAHEVTLLRANFTLSRAVLRATAMQIPAAYRRIKHNPAHLECVACQRLQAKGEVALSEAVVEPPSDCQREACSVMLVVQFNYLDWAENNAANHGQ